MSDIRYYYQHPGIEIPKFLQGDKWVDNSWRNDTCAKSELELDATTMESIRVWVEREDKADREYPEDGARFVVEHVRNEEEHTSGEARVLYQGESEGIAESAVEEFLRTELAGQQAIQMVNPPTSDAWQKASARIHLLAKALTGKTPQDATA